MHTKVASHANIRSNTKNRAVKAEVTLIQQYTPRVNAQGKNKRQHTYLNSSVFSASLKFSILVDGGLNKNEKQS